jgi:hypothetical protein
MLGVGVISQSHNNISLLRKNNRIHDRTGVFIPILILNVNKKEAGNGHRPLRMDCIGR